jgi:archaetidylinositol phosphate synthase
VWGRQSCRQAGVRAGFLRNFVAEKGRPGGRLAARTGRPTYKHEGTLTILVRHYYMQLTSEFRPAERANTSALASMEKRALIWLASHMPPWVNSDHLTALGFVSLFGVGLSYWYSRYSPAGLILVILFFVLNWFGDSLDGTLARVRNRQRPRYGFYLDHVLDACGSVFVFAGLALSGYMSERVAVGLLVAYFLLSIEIYLATYTVGKFHLSFAAFGPTELRLLLIAGNIALLNKPQVILAGKQYLLFDVGGTIGIIGISIALLWSIVKHTTHLYNAERLS